MKLLMKILLLTLSMQHLGAYTNFDDVLLVINYNHAYYDSIPLLKAMYTPVFKNIVFYGPKAHPDVVLCEHRDGYFSYTAISDAMARYPRYTGYLFLHDDCILNTEAMAQSSLDKWVPWVPRTPFGLFDTGGAIDTRNEYKLWGWWNTPWGRGPAIKVFNALPHEAKRMLAANWGAFNVVFGYADFAYIPGRFRKTYTELANLCRSKELFLEIGLPTLIACLCPKGQLLHLTGFNGLNDLSQFRGDLFFNHPVKLSKKVNQDFIKELFHLP